MNPIVYIHGAGSNNACFEVLRQRLPDHEVINYDYDCLSVSINDLVSHLAASVPDRPFDIIGHSLGGVLAVLLAQQCEQVRRIFTMATPFAGSEIAVMLQFMVPERNGFYRQIATTSPHIWRMLMVPTGKPIRAVVASGGSTVLLPQPNDGVVTVASQMALMGAEYRIVNLAHLEVLLSQEVADFAREFLFDQ